MQPGPRPSGAEEQRDIVRAPRFVQAFGNRLQKRVDAFTAESVSHGRAPVESNLEHLAADREHLARLNMALAYIEQGDIGSACDILNEVISTGDAQEQQRARELLAKIA